MDIPTKLRSGQLASRGAVAGWQHSKKRALKRQRSHGVKNHNVKTMGQTGLVQLRDAPKRNCRAFFRRSTAALTFCSPQSLVFKKGLSHDQPRISELHGSPWCRNQPQHDASISPLLSQESSGLKDWITGQRDTSPAAWHHGCSAESITQGSAPSAATRSLR